MEVATLRSRLPLHTRSVSGTSWKTSTASCLTIEKSLISIVPMDGCLQISPRTIWRISKYSMLRSALPWKSRCMSPLPIAVDRRLPPPSIESPLHLVPLPLVLILRHRFVDLAAQTGLGPLRMTARVRGTPSVVILAPVAVRMNVMRNELFLATPLPTGEGPVIGSRLLADIWTSQASPPRPARSGSLRRGRIRHHGNDSLLEGHPLLSEGASLLTLHSRSDSPLGGHLRLLRSDLPHGGRLLRLRSDSPHGGHLRLPRGASPQRGHPHPSEWDSLQKQGLAPPGDPFLGSHVLQGHTPPGIPPLQREVPLPLNDDAMSRGTQSLLITITHLELRLESLLKGDPIQDLLLTTLPRLHGRRRKLMRPLCHRRLRRWLTLS